MTKTQSATEKLNKWEFEEKFFTPNFQDKVFEYWYKDTSMTDEERQDDFNRNHENSYTTLLRDILDTVAI